MASRTAPPGFDEFGTEEFEFVPEEPDGEYEGFDDGWRFRIGAAFTWLLMRIGWVSLAVVVSFGSAGIVAATGQSPANDGRPELTYSADVKLSARLDAGVRDLARLNDDVLVLGQMARDVLADLSQVNQPGMDSSYQDGDTALQNITAAAAALDSKLDCEPWSTAREDELGKTYSQAMIDRWSSVCTAIDSVSPLAENWAALVSGSKVAMQVAHDINDHDQAVTAALQLANQGRFADALAGLAPATASLADAQRIDSDFAKVTDVSTLTEWLARTKTFDDALALLWQTMIDSKGRVTKQTGAALIAVNDAKALLPDNAAVLQVVLYEMAGTLTADGIAIEVAKGQLASALADLTGGTSSG